jgi:biopolymer transport protein ExbB
MKCFKLSFIGFFLSAIYASAVPLVAAGVAPPVPEEVNFLEILAKGGIMMYPLGLMSVVGMLLVLLFFLTLRRNAIVSDRFMHNAESMIRKRDYVGLADLSERRNECMARIVQKILDFLITNPTSSFENVRDVAQAEGSRQAGMLTSRINYLADIGAIAPMVGLLGTVIGMIKAFLHIASGQVAGVKEMGLAGGVSEALIATAGGLAISIPAFIFYAIFRSRVQKYISEMEAATTHLIALLHTQYERTLKHSQQNQGTAKQGARDEYVMPGSSPLAGERPDVHGI